MTEKTGPRVMDTLSCLNRAGKNQDGVFRNRIIAHSAERPATASNPGAFVVPGAAVAAGVSGAGDVAGKDTAGPASPEWPRAGVTVVVAAVVVAGALTYRNRVAGPREPPSPTVLVMAIGTDPGACAGVIRVMWLSSVTFRPVTDFSPNRTSFVPVNPDPVSVTAVPPSAGPDDGEIPVSFGTGIS